jgi:DNA-binding transcriptional ArsR family regulator
MNAESEPINATEERTIDLESLKALAHPLRIKIIDVLSTYGSFTASGLAERLGESSGATSYHLRQLEKHGFVREVAGKGTGRERWWERVPGGLTLGSKEFTASEVGREASQLVMREWATSRERTLREFMDAGLDVLPQPWIDASVISLTSVNLTAEQLNQFTEEFMAVVRAFADKYRGQSVEGARPVQIQFHAFPVIDGVETPSKDAQS